MAVLRRIFFEAGERKRAGLELCQFGWLMIDERNDEDDNHDARFCMLAGGKQDCTCRFGPANNKLVCNLNTPTNLSAAPPPQLTTESMAAAAGRLHRCLAANCGPSGEAAAGLHLCRGFPHVGSPLRDRAALRECTCCRAPAAPNRAKPLCSRGHGRRRRPPFGPVRGLPGQHQRRQRQRRRLQVANLDSPSSRTGSGAAKRTHAAGELAEICPTLAASAPRRRAKTNRNKNSHFPSSSDVILIGNR